MFIVTYGTIFAVNYYKVIIELRLSIRQSATLNFIVKLLRRLTKFSINL